MDNPFVVDFTGWTRIRDRDPCCRSAGVVLVLKPDGPPE